MSKVHKRGIYEIWAYLLRTNSVKRSVYFPTHDWGYRTAGVWQVLKRTFTKHRLLVTPDIEPHPDSKTWVAGFILPIVHSDMTVYVHGQKRWQ